MGRSSTCCQRKLSRLCGRKLVARRCLMPCNHFTLLTCNSHVTVWTLCRAHMASRYI